jgi:hypothetical protein
MKIALLLKRLGLTSTLLHSMGAASIAGSLSLWGRSAAVSNKDAKARRGVYHGCCYLPALVGCADRSVPDCLSRLRRPGQEPGGVRRHLP